MKYVLITKSGKQYLFYIRGCAEIFQGIYGGEIHELEGTTDS
jgi:hypothetical protein